MARAVGSKLGIVGSWVLVAGLLGASIARPVACTPAPSGDEDYEEAVLDVLGAAGPNVVVPALVRAGDAAEVMAREVANWEASLAINPGGDLIAHASARTRWRETMAVWQEVEVMQIGPDGGELRDEIYSWPTVNRCLVDQITVSGDYEAPDFFDTALVTAYGLDALEVLLFAPDDENGCPPQVDINADGTWDALGVDGVTARRAAYASVVANGIADRIAELEAAWDPAREDFSGALAAPGSVSSPYDSAGEALNAVFDALFYLETMTKDRKLGLPLGLVDCTGDACLDEVESPFAEESHNWIEVNLVAFRALFDGGTGAGLDDLLVERGHAATADAMRKALDAADAAAAALEVPIDEAAGTDIRVFALYDALGVVTDLLKGDVATLLALTIPDEAAGDND